MFPLCCSGVLKTKEVKLRVWLPHRGVFRGCLFTSDASKKYSKLEPRLFTIIAFFFLPPLHVRLRNASQHSERVMFKHNSLSLCCAAPSVQVTRAEKAAGQIRGGALSVGLRSCLCCIVRRARDHLQKSSARLNLKLNMDKRARSRSQMMISSKCTKQTKDTHTRLLSSGSSE